MAASVLLLPGLLFGASQDAAVYTTVADRLRDGVLPYEGAWDHKPPGAYVVYALVQVALQMTGPWTAVWIASVAAVLATGALTARIMSRLNVPGASAVAVGFVIVALALPPVAQGGGHTEHLALVPAVAAFAVALSGTRLIAGLSGGVLLGFALLTSLQVVPVIAGTVVVAALLRGVRQVAAIAFGIAIVLVSAALILLGSGLAAVAADAVITYSVAYREMNVREQAAVVAGALRAGIMATAAALLPIALGLTSGLRSQGGRQLVCIGCAVWLLTGAVWIAYQGRLEGHYLVPLAVPAAILFAIGTSKLSADFVSMPAIRLPAISLLLVLGLINVATLIHASEVTWGELRETSRRTEAVVDAIGARDAIAGTLFVWGNRPQVYYASGRVPASRFIYLAPLTTPGYSSPAQINEVVEEIIAEPPAYFVDAGSPSPGLPGLPPLLVERPVLAYGRDYDVLDPIRRFVRANYSLLGVVEGWPVYALRENRSGPYASTLSARAWSSVSDR